MFRSLDAAEEDAIRPWRPASIAAPSAAVPPTAQAWPGLAGAALPRDGAFVVAGNAAEGTSDGRSAAVDGVDGGAADGEEAAGRASEVPDAPDAVERARGDAFDAGFAAGNAAARDAFADEVAQLACAFARETAIRVEELETELVALARTMASCAIRRELAHDPALYGTLVRDALESLAGADAGAGPGVTTVRLHPVTAELLGDACGPDVRIVADPALARTDCLLERGPSRIDASIHARLDALALNAGEAPDAGERPGRDA